MSGRHVAVAAILVGAGLTLIVGVALQSAAGGPVPDVGGGWITASSTHFTVFSNAGRRKTVRVTNDLEELRGALVRLSSDEPVEGVPTVLFLFENDRSFEPFKFLEDGEPASLSGFFRSTREANIIALDSTAGYDSGVVFHEYVHCWLSRRRERMPLWVEEGLAELYQTFAVSGDRIQFGKPIGRHLSWFQDHPLIPLEVFWAVDHQDPFYTEAGKKPGFYAQSWALVHLFVLGDPERSPQLRRYLDLLAQGTGHEEAFASAFDGDIEGLEGDLERYVHRKIFRIFSLELDLGLAPEIEVRTMSETEVLTRLGELLQSETPPRPEAHRYFESALLADGDAGQALVGLARIAELERNWKLAQLLYARAVAAAPDDAMVLYRYGDAQVAGGGDLEAAIPALEKSVALAPRFGPAWSALAAALLDAGEGSEELLHAARTAHRLLPFDRDATWDLLTVLIAAEHWAEARAFIDSAFLTQGAERGRALRLLAHGGLERTHELIAKGACELALNRVDWADENLPGADDEQTLGQRIVDARSAVDQCHFRNRFDAAEELLEHGQEDAARLILVEIAEQMPESDLSRRALHLVDRIDNPGGEEEASSSLVISAISADELKRLNSLLESGDFEHALEILIELRARSGPAEGVWIDHKINEVRGVLEHNHYVEVFNHGVDLYNAKDYALAARLLEKLVQEMPAGFDTSSARSLLDKARAAMGP